MPSSSLVTMASKFNDTARDVHDQLGEPPELRSGVPSAFSFQGVAQECILLWVKPAYLQCLVHPLLEGAICSNVARCLRKLQALQWMWCSVELE